MGDYVFSRFHYTWVGENDQRMHIGFAENNGGVWECELDEWGGFRI